MTGNPLNGFCSTHPNIYYQVWCPAQEPEAVVMIAHGMGGHGGQFENAAIAFLEKNFVTYALDFRGHGRSDGVRGYIKRWSNYLDDLQSLSRLVRQEHPDLPVFLWGHSLGGLISLDYALQFPADLAGLLLTAPAVGKTAISALKLLIGQVMSWVWPTFSLDAGFDSRACCRDREIAARYVADPIRHHRGTARLSTEFKVAQERILSQVDALQVPLLLMHGNADRITSPDSSVALFEQMSDGDRKLIRYPHAYHELHLDLNRDQVLGDMLDWMLAHAMPETSESQVL